MFTIHQIQAAHSKVKSGADFPAYIQELKQLGIKNYETFVTDGHTDYYGSNDYKQSSDAKYEAKQIAAESNAAEFMKELKAHQQGQTDYPTFCKMCADTGIEKWLVSIDDMTCTYYDKAGNRILEEKIPG
ncbi:MAG: DUF1398 domain-containing protein [Sphingobacteriales bacterium]|nr:MAG: DUF1398 domain-containing protein [Sphingobacteriales bacterium]